MAYEVQHKLLRHANNKHVPFFLLLLPVFFLVPLLLQKSREPFGSDKNNVDKIISEGLPEIHGQHENNDATTKTRRYDEYAEEADYATDPLCGGCRWTPSGHMTYRTCGSLIVARAQRERISMLQAARLEITQANRTECAVCLKCPERHKRYWRPDRAAPRIHRAVTHYLASIPPRYRIPRKELGTLDNDHLKRYFREHPAGPNDERRYLFEYNPSIVQYVPGKTNPDFTMLGETPVYVASFRVATQQACFPTETTLQLIGGDWGHRPESTSYLGLALLREDLSVIMDGVFDVTVFGNQKEDFRLFYLNEQLWVTTFRRLTPLWIGRDGQPPHHREGYTKEMPPRFPKTTRLRLSMGRVVILATPDVDLYVDSGKNLNYFTDATGKVHMQFNTPGNFQSNPQPNVVQPVHLDVEDTKGILGRPVPPRYDFYNFSVTSIPKEGQSFYTLDELELEQQHQHYESPYSADRGGT